jgi:hypothetical protein
MQGVEFSDEEVAFLLLEMSYMIRREKGELDQLVADESSGAVAVQAVHDRAVAQSRQTLQVLEAIMRKLEAARGNGQ